MTREEAIDIVRKNYPHVGVSGSQFETALRNLIPELRESEDERIRKWLSECVENLSDGNFIEVSRQDVLCYLEKQKEQKPAWSEEDEAMIKSILFVLESYVSHSESASSPSLITSYPTYYKEIDWLKSLRPVSKESLQPHWKPNEEQMDALKDVAYGTYQNEDGPALRSLYEQLKKLM